VEYTKICFSSRSINKQFLNILLAMAVKRKRTMSKRKRPIRKRSRRSKKLNDYSLYKPQGKKPELKTLDVVVGSTNWATSGTSVMLNLCTLGTGVSNRIANMITVKSIMLKMVCFLDSAFLAGNACHFRFGLFYDKQPNGLAATYAVIFSPETGGTSSLAPRLLSTRERFQVLHEQDFVMDADAYNVEFKKAYVKCSLPVVFNSANTGLISDIQTGSIGAYFCYFPNTIIPAAPTFQFQSRIRFTDV